MSYCTRKRPCFKIIAAVPNRFKYRQNVPFTVFVFIVISAFPKLFQMQSECTVYRPCSHFCLQFQIVSNSVRMHALDALVLKHSLQFHNVSSTVRIHHLALLNSKFSLQFQMVSNAVRMDYLLSLFSKCSLQFQIVSNAVRIHRVSSLFSFSVYSYESNRSK